MAYADRKQYYLKRKERFENKHNCPDEQEVQSQDIPHPTQKEENMGDGLDNVMLKDAARDLRDKGKSKGTKGKKRPHQPDPSVDFSEFWDMDEAARWGYVSVPQYRKDKRDGNLPYQRQSASDEAASSAANSAGRTLPFPRTEIAHCTQCNEPCAIANMWRCYSCSEAYKCEALFHGYSTHKNCYEEHNHYCKARSIFGWQRRENKRGRYDNAEAGR